MSFCKSLVNVFFHLAGFKAHSHTLMIFHPSFFNAFKDLASLAMLVLILLSHHSVLVLGTTKVFAVVVTCQKQPCTKLPCGIGAKQYRVYREALYHLVCGGTRVHVKTCGAVFPVSCLALRIRLML